MTVWLKRVHYTGVMAALVVAALMAASSCAFHHTKYENPITKDTQQPDKLLYDKAIKDLEKGRYEMARLTLNTLINTYDSSEFLAKSLLAIGDSWYKEGGVSGFAQAEQQYKDFELYYPTMPEAAEAQYKICQTHMNQMGKPDRDVNQTLRAEQECKQVVTQYPNSKYVTQAEQDLRNIDEVLAEGEMETGNLYYKKGSRPAAANRYAGLVEQYPLYSKADEALWRESEEYLGMGARLRPQAVQALQKLVRDYPLSAYADDAKKKLHDLESEVPEADPAALARMKYEQDNRTKTSTLHDATSFLRQGPETSMAAKTGTPAMNPPKQSIPANVPSPQGVAGFNGDVTVAPVTATPTLAVAPTATSPDPSTQKQAANSKDKKNAKKNAKKADKKQDQATTADPNQAPAPPRDPIVSPVQAPPR